MKCSEVRSFLSEIQDRVGTITPIPSSDFDYLSISGYVLRTVKEDYDKGVEDVARLTQMSIQLSTQNAEEQRDAALLREDQQKEHSFLFHLEDKEKKDELQERVQREIATVSGEESALVVLETNVNDLIQKKSMIDRMVPYGEEYVSVTGLGTLILNDLNVRNYRVADQEFSDFLNEIKATYAQLRSIGDKATSYVIMLKPRIPGIEETQYSNNPVDDRGHLSVQAPSLLWSLAIGLAKLQGDTYQIGERFIQSMNILLNLDSTVSNKLMAAEIMTAINSQDLQTLQTVLMALDKQLRDQGVPKELSAGVAATIMGGRRYDGTYPLDRFIQFRQQTSSYESAAILSVMNLPYPDLSAKFQSFRSTFTSWGYMASEDTEIASAFLAIGELNANEVVEKLKYIIEQLHNYLEYPLVAAAILASIPVFEAHEVLDLMEKAVTLLAGYATSLERSELVALAVRMIHGVRNDLVKEIDSTAPITNTPVQFTYMPHPGLFFWYFPVIVAHSAYHATFSGMGGFHPAHSHGVGGFAG